EGELPRQDRVLSQDFERDFRPAQMAREVAKPFLWRIALENATQPCDVQLQHERTPGQGEKLPRQVSEADRLERRGIDRRRRVSENHWLKSFEQTTRAVSRERFSATQKPVELLPHASRERGGSRCFGGKSLGQCRQPRCVAEE